MSFGVPSHCPICGRKVPDGPEPCSDACEREEDRRREVPGDWEQAQMNAWLDDDPGERRRAA